MKNPFWIPSQERIDTSNINAYIKFINKKYKKSFNSYNELYYWSVNNIEDFWVSIWKFSKIKYSKKYNSVLTADKMFGAKWFTEAKLNFAENLLRYNDSKKAIVSFRENYPRVELTYKELNLLVAKLTNSLMKLGVKKGDRVSGFFSNIRIISYVEDFCTSE